MTWAPTGGGGNSAPGGTPTSVAVTLSVAVAVGDTINCAACMDVGGGSTGGVITDSLGNTYTRESSVLDTGNNERIETYKCIVTNAGTPTVTLRFTPTPGTTVSSSPGFAVDPFTGSDAASTSDGTGAAQVQPTPSTTTDLTSSGTWTTSTNGDLIYTACCDSSTGLNPGTVGTGFTALQTSGFVSIKTAYKVQPTASATTAGLWTAAANDAHITAAHAVKPAAGGAATTPADRAHSQQHQALIAA